MVFEMQLTRFFEIQRGLIDLLRASSLLKSIRIVLYEAAPNSSINAQRDEIVNDLFLARERLHTVEKDEETNQVAGKSGILSLFSVQNSTFMIVALQNAAQMAQIRNDGSVHARFAHFYWTLASFVAQHDALDSLVIKGRENNDGGADSTLLFEIFDLGQQGFDPDRIAKILPEIEALFVAVGAACQITETKIQLSFFDSGSNLLIGVKAAGALVGEVRKFLNDFLPMVRDWKSAKIKGKLEALSAGLELCQRIDRMKVEGVFQPETAARAKHDVLASVSNLVSDGAYLREVKGEVIDYRRALLDAAEVKQLEAPKS